MFKFVKTISIMIVVLSVLVAAYSVKDQCIASEINESNSSINNIAVTDQSEATTNNSEESTSEEITNETVTTTITATAESINNSDSKETTTKASTTTTKKSETTTKKPETTTKKVETTVKKPSSSATTTTTKAATASLVPKTPSLSTVERETFNAVNEYRKANGLNELKWDSQLHAAAEIRAKECSILWDSSHKRPDGTIFSNILFENNYKFTYASENLCKSKTERATAEHMIQLLKDSPKHNDAMLSSRITKCGFAVYESAETGCTYLVQIFSN